MFHQSLKGSGCVAESKGHDFKLPMSVACYRECCFFDGFGAKLNLPVPRLQIKSCEPSRSLLCFHCIVYPRQRIRIFSCNVVQLTVSTQNRVVPFFLRTKTIGDDQGLADCSIIPSFNISSTAHPASSLFILGIRLACCFIGGWSPVKMLCFTTFVCPMSKALFENTSEYSHKKFFNNTCSSSF